MDKRAGWAALIGFIGTVIAANLAVTYLGVVPVGFGLMAPAAVYFVGLAFSLRDMAQEGLGRRAVAVAILVGAVLSAAFSPAIALASGAAFLVSELLDLGVYTQVRERSWLGAIALSNTVGLVVDSVVFLALATPLGPDRMSFLPGQIVGKAWMTALFLGGFALARRRRSKIA